MGETWYIFILEQNKYIPPSSIDGVCSYEGGGWGGVTFQPHQKTNEAILWTFIEFRISCARTVLWSGRDCFPPGGSSHLIFGTFETLISFDDLILKFCLVTRRWRL